MDTDYNVFTVGVSEGVGVRGGECQGDGSRECQGDGSLDNSR